MKNSTKQFLGIAVASALVIGVANGVFAHGGFGAGYGPGWGGHQGMMMGGPGGMQGPYGGPGRMGGGFPAVQTEQGLEQVKATLGITAEQEPAWNAYADAIKGKTELRQAHRDARFGAGTAPGQRLQFREEGLAQMQQLVDASRDLYAVLTPDQKARSGALIGAHCTLW